MNDKPHKSLTHEEMFFHIREPLGSSLAKYYRGATVFARKEVDGFWYASVALCSIKDVFQKRVGRSQARRRYFDPGQWDRHLWGSKPTYGDAQCLARFMAG